jgi:hypothetical protein
MDPEKKEPKPFDPEDTGELDIPPAMRQAAQEMLDKQNAGGQKHFDAETTNEIHPSAIFETLDDKLADESLAAERMLDMQRLAPIVAERGGGSFDDKVLESGVDSVVAQKLTQYEVEKEFFAVPTEQFYEDTGLAREMNETPRLSEDQQSLLETVTKLSDGLGFEEVHPDLGRQESLPPTSAPVIDYDDIGIPKIDAPATPEPFASTLDGAGVQANLTYEKMQVLKGEKESTDLLERAKGPHAIASVDRDSLLRRRPPMSTEMKIAIGLVALGIPLFAWSIYVQTNENARADLLQQEASVALATESADRHSAATQMEEPFRMPAGSVGPQGAPSGTAFGNAGSNGMAGGDQTVWHAPEHPAPAPTTQQLEEDRKIMTLAEQQQALGNTSQALYVLNAGLSKSPGDVQLVMSTARAYINTRDYATARRILSAAMKNARTLGDFSLLQQMLNQLPPA